MQKCQEEDDDIEVELPPLENLCFGAGQPGIPEDCEEDVLPLPSIKNSFPLAKYRPKRTTSAAPGGVSPIEDKRDSSNLGNDKDEGDFFFHEDEDDDNASLPNTNLEQPRLDEHGMEGGEDENFNTSFKMGEQLIRVMSRETLHEEIVFSGSDTESS